MTATRKLKAQSGKQMAVYPESQSRPHCPEGQSCPHCPEVQLLTPCSEDLSKVHCSPCPPSNYTKDRKTGNLTLLETGRGSGLGGTELRSGQGKGQG